jgi:predicted HAD superfamily phosphohydrolase YqeG
LKSLATGNSPFTTFFQVVTRLPTIVRQMRPTWHVRSLIMVDAAFVAKHGIKGMIWDVDGTLTGDRQATLAPEAEPAFRALMAASGLRHVVLSNAGEERFTQLGAMFPMMPILRAYTLGDQVLYRRLQGTDDTWTRQDLERQLAAGAAVIRKPNALLVDQAAKELGLAKDDIAMIGDQYLTDVAGANLGGVRSIKLPTLARETFRTSVKLSQRFELVLYGLLHGRARWTTV